MRLRPPSLQESGLILLACIPIFGVILLVARYGYTVPWIDEYVRMVPLVIMQREGTLTPADLLIQYGDHRVTIPYALSVIFAALTGGDLRWEIAFSILIAIVSLGLVYDLYRSKASSRVEALIFLVPAAFLLFSLGQRENWIWGNQKLMFLMMLATYASAWALERFPRTWRGFWICAAGALLAAWSFLGGNVLWGVIPIALWLNGYRRWTFYALWLGIAAASIALYLNGFVPDRSYASEWNAAFGGDQIRYILAYLGNVFTGQTLHLMQGFNGVSGWFQPLLPVLMGVLGVVLLGANLALAIFVRRQTLAELSPWLLLVGFSLASGLLLTIGRSDLTGALVARYITLANPFWLAVIALMIANASYILREKPRTPRWRTNMMRAAAVCAILLVVGYASNTLRAYELRESYNDVMEQCFLTRLEADERCRIGQFFYQELMDEDDVIALLDKAREHQVFLFRPQ